VKIMDPQKLRKKMERIDGWLHHTEGDLLYRLAKNCTEKGVIVEIGSWKGKSTICLAFGSKEGKHIPVYAIDPHTGSSEHRQMFGQVWTYDEFIANIRKNKLDDIVKPIVNTSVKAAETFYEPVELLFVDGAHEYEEVKKDFELWFPKIVSGGIIAFHDATCNDGPQRIVNEYVYNSNHFRNIQNTYNIIYAEKN
jgi:MMP 1-O-methyltransferase